jgi:glycosyltransferase involved in cell wall biosynthesis
MRQLSNFLSAHAQLTVLTQFFPPDYAATGQLIDELARSFCQHDIGVHVFTGQPGYAYEHAMAPKQEVVQGVKVYRTRTSRLWPRRIRGRAIGGLLYCIRAFFRLLHPKYRKALLLVTTEPPYLPVVAYLMHWLFNQPYICLLYDLYPDVAVTLGVVPAKSIVVRFWHWLNRRTWRHAKAIVVLSPTMKQRILDICPEASGKVTVIHNWADPNLVKPVPKAENWFARQHGLQDVFTVMYSGNMGRCHDMETILAAAAELRHEPIKFVFIGDGAKRQPCMDKVERLRLTNCLFLPYQPKQHLSFSLTACDLSLVSIDTNIEGLVAPSKFYGCLAAGRPIAAICESHSYLRSMLAEAGCGRAFDNGDGLGLAAYIRSLLADPSGTARMGERARRYLLDNFTPERCAHRYLQVVRESISAAGILAPVYVTRTKGRE